MESRVMGNQANPERRRSRTVVFHRKVQHTVVVIVRIAVALVYP